MDVFLDQFSKSFTERWFQHIWVDGGSFYDLCHEEAMFLDFKALGCDLETYSVFRDLLIRTFRYDDFEVVAGISKGTSLQSMARCRITHRRTGGQAMVTGGHHIVLSDDKVISRIGFFDYSAYISLMDPDLDHQLFDLLAPNAKVECV